MMRAPVSRCVMTFVPISHCLAQVPFSLIMVAIFSKMFFTWSMLDATTPYWPLWRTSMVATVSTMAAAISVLPYPDGSPMMARRCVRRHRPPRTSPQANSGSHMLSRWKSSRRNGVP